MKLRGHGNLLELSDGKAPPTEFLIFRAGINRTRNGYRVLFDDVAARAVMAAYEEHGTELMVDLEHMSIDDKAPNWNPNAQGWLTLEVRDGALWATKVRWTPEGGERLANQQQRFTSPWFAWEPVDGDDRVVRPTRILNVALVAMPGTDHLPALVAKEQRSMKISQKDLVRAARLLKHNDLKKLEEGDGQVAGVDLPGLADFLGISIDSKSDPAGFIREIKAKLGEVLTQLDGGPPPAAPTEEAAPSELAAARMQANVSTLLKLTGKTDIDAALVEVSDMRQLALNHRTEAEKVAADAKALEDTKRRALTARLIACGSETPGTAWSDELKTTPAKHLLALTLAELESRALSMEALSPKRGPLTPATGKDAATGLTQTELLKCKQKGVDPAVYAASKKALDERCVRRSSAATEG